MNLSPTQEAQITTVRQRLDGARIAAGLRDGSIVRTTYERCLVLAARRDAHLKAGRVRAAVACKENAMRILDEAGY